MNYVIVKRFVKCFFLVDIIFSIFVRYNGILGYIYFKVFEI